MANRLTRCPTCDGPLTVTELTCSRCHIRIQGAFAGCRFCQVAPEHLSFVESFLRCEGNLSRLGEELGVSYPTVRNRLAAALAALGLHSEASQPEPAASPTRSRMETLEAVARGELSIEEALALLRSQ
ncbi:MAG: DUF2089 domain-containing protein [Chloroherpetonaceae bacterium]|nr:DUF2089 domain-containing protein [Chthonomonadaceae bacterium]MDW8206649.1 DUF2089 domain-containing protein [Chloroherpetonaceae bacterium]